MRFERVFDVAPSVFERQIQSTYTELQDYYKLNCHDIDRQIFELFEKLSGMGVYAQQEGKGEISCLCISYLYSSLVTGTGEFCLSLYDDRVYFDDNPIYIFWSPVFLWRQFDKDVEEIICSFKKLGIRLKKYELDAVKIEYVEQFFKIGHKMFADYSKLIITTMKNSTLKTTKDFSVIYGGYLDTATEIWRGNV